MHFYFTMIFVFLHNQKSPVIIWFSEKPPVQMKYFCCIILNIPV